MDKIDINSKNLKDKTINTFPWIFDISKYFHDILEKVLVK